MHIYDHCFNDNLDISDPIQDNPDGIAANEIDKDESNEDIASDGMDMTDMHTLVQQYASEMDTGR